MGTAALRFDLESPSCSVATFDDTVLLFIHKEVTAEALRASQQAHLRLSATFPSRVGCLTIVNIGVSIPDSAMRKLAAETIAATRQHLRCAAQVLTGEGFLASTVRSVITAVERLRPDDRPRRTFPDVASAVEWMALHMERDAEWQRALCHAAMTAMQASAA